MRGGRCRCSAINNVYEGERGGGVGWSGGGGVLLESLFQRGYLGKHFLGLIFLSGFFLDVSFCNDCLSAQIRISYGTGRVAGTPSSRCCSESPDRRARIALANRSRRSSQSLSDRSFAVAAACLTYFHVGDVGDLRVVLTDHSCLDNVPVCSGRYVVMRFW